MLFKIIYNFFIGYSKVRIEGYYIERFMNTCIRNGVLLWKIYRDKSTIMFANVGLKDKEKVIKYAEKYQCQVTIIKESGFPYLLKKYQKRKVFFLLFIVIIFIIIGLSNFVWNIQVDGNSKISADDIIKIAKDNGLNIGTLKSKVDIGKVINQVRLERDDVSWIGIEIKGTNAIIKIVEAEPKPKIIDDKDYTNIVAKKDGIITKITAQNGTAMVKEGDSVKKGDVLISGCMEGKYTGKYYVNSNGEVKSKITYLKNEKINKTEVKRSQTGKSERRYSININNFQINFYKRVSKFEKYDTMYASKKLSFLEFFNLPIYIIETTNHEVKEETINHDKESAIATAIQLADDELKNMIDGDIINKSTEVIENDDYYDVNVTYEVIEEIGTEEKIEF